ncbi:very large A-kinase anchor protein [Bombina bombina]|uniref:very large A-kinase anchor protein n=1 Tax=Bombina bombina TaxID=8345 RepID=UPI00235AC448|nr:very large A-kinase anchor protein [Bombina bombina]
MSSRRRAGTWQEEVAKGFSRLFSKSPSQEKEEDNEKPPTNKDAEDDQDKADKSFSRLFFRVQSQERKESSETLEEQEILGQISPRSLSRALSQDSKEDSSDVSNKGTKEQGRAKVFSRLFSRASSQEKEDENDKSKTRIVTAELSSQEDKNRGLTPDNNENLPKEPVQNLQESYPGALIQNVSTNIEEEKDSGEKKEEEKIANMTIDDKQLEQDKQPREKFLHFFENIFNFTSKSTGVNLKQNIASQELPKENGDILEKDNTDEREFKQEQTLDADIANETEETITSKHGVNDVAVPVKDMAVPVIDMARTIKDTTLPVIDTIVLVNDTAVPIKDMMVPVKDMMVPVKDTAVPIKDQMEPINNMEVHVDDRTVAMNYMEVPNKDTTTLINNAAVPIKDTSVPIENTAVQVIDTAVPVIDKTEPVNDMEVLDKNTAVPVKDKTRSTKVTRPECEQKTADSQKQHISKQASPSMSYGTYRGSKRIRKLRKGRLDVNSPIPEREETTEREFELLNDNPENPAPKHQLSHSEICPQAESPPLKEIKMQLSTEDFDNADELSKSFPNVHVELNSDIPFLDSNAPLSSSAAEVYSNDKSVNPQNLEKQNITSIEETANSQSNAITLLRVTENDSENNPTKDCVTKNNEIETSSRDDKPTCIVNLENFAHVPSQPALDTSSNVCSLEVGFTNVQNNEIMASCSALPEKSNSSIQKTNDTRSKSPKHHCDIAAKMLLVRDSESVNTLQSLDNGNMSNETSVDNFTTANNDNGDYCAEENSRDPMEKNAKEIKDHGTKNEVEPSTHDDKATFILSSPQVSSQPKVDRSNKECSSEVSTEDVQNEIMTSPSVLPEQLNSSTHKTEYINSHTCTHLFNISGETGSVYGLSENINTLHNLENNNMAKEITIGNCPAAKNTNMYNYVEDNSRDLIKTNAETIKGYGTKNDEVEPTLNNDKSIFILNFPQVPSQPVLDTSNTACPLEVSSENMQNKEVTISPSVLPEQPNGSIHQTNDIISPILKHTSAKKILDSSESFNSMQNLDNGNVPNDTLIENCTAPNNNDEGQYPLEDWGNRKKLNEDKIKAVNLSYPVTHLNASNMPNASLLAEKCQRDLMTDEKSVSDSHLSIICCFTASPQIDREDVCDKRQSPNVTVIPSSLPTCTDVKRVSPFPPFGETDSGVVSALASTSEENIPVTISQSDSHIKIVSPETENHQKPKMTDFVEPDDLMDETNTIAKSSNNTNEMGIFPELQEAKVCSNNESTPSIDLQFINDHVNVVFNPRSNVNVNTSLLEPQELQRPTSFHTEEVYLAKVSLKSVDIEEVKMAKYTLQSDIISVCTLESPKFEPEYVCLPNLSPAAVATIEDQNCAKVEQQASNAKNIINDKVDTEKDLINVNQDISSEQVNDKCTLHTFISNNSEDLQIAMPKTNITSEAESKNVDLIFTSNKTINVSGHTTLEPNDSIVHSESPVPVERFQDVFKENTENNNLLPCTKLLNGNSLDMSVQILKPENKITGEALQSHFAHVECKVSDALKSNPDLLMDLAIIHNKTCPVPVRETDVILPVKSHTESLDILLRQKTNEIIHTALTLAMNEVNSKQKNITALTSENNLSLIIPDITETKLTEHKSNVNKLPENSAVSSEENCIESALADVPCENVFHNYPERKDIFVTTAQDLINEVIISSKQKIMSDLQQNSLNKNLITDNTESEMIENQNMPFKDCTSETSNSITHLCKNESLLEMDNRCIDSNTLSIEAIEQGDSRNAFQNIKCKQPPNQIIGHDIMVSGEQNITSDLLQNTVNKQLIAVDSAELVDSEDLNSTQTDGSSDNDNDTVHLDKNRGLSKSGHEYGGSNIFTTTDTEKQTSDKPCGTTDVVHYETKDIFLSKAQEMANDVIVPDLLQNTLSKNISIDDTNDSGISNNQSMTLAPDREKAVKGISDVGQYLLSSDIYSECIENREFDTIELEHGIENDNLTNTLSEEKINNPMAKENITFTETEDNIESRNQSDILKTYCSEIGQTENNCWDSKEENNLYHTMDDFSELLNFSLYNCRYIEGVYNEDEPADEENNTSDNNSDSFLSFQAKRVKIYPFSLSPIYEDNSSGEDVLSNSVSPKHFDSPDSKNCSNDHASILSLLQSVSDKLKQTDERLDTEEPSSEKGLMLSDGKPEEDNYKINTTEILEKTSSLPNTHPVVPRNESFLHEKEKTTTESSPTQISTQYNMFITKSAPDIRHLSGTGRQSFLLQIKQTSSKFGQKSSEETTSPSASENEKSLLPVDSSASEMHSNNATSETVSTNSPSLKVTTEPNRSIQNSDTENKRLASRSVYYQYFNAAQDYSDTQQNKGSSFLDRLCNSQAISSHKGQTPVMSPVDSSSLKFNPRPGKVIFSDIIDSENKIEFNNDVLDATSWKFPNGVNIRVIRGCWILYEKPSFQGQTRVLEEGEAALNCLWDPSADEISIGSLKRIAKDGRIPEVLICKRYGSRMPFQTEIPSLESLTSGCISSLTVKSGVWLAYAKKQFSGDVIVLEEHCEVEECDFRSLRPLKMGGLKVQKPSDPKIILYQKPHFKGWSKELTEHAYSLKSLLCDGEDQDIGSIRVIGGIWVGYEKERYKGHQYLLEEGEYEDCHAWGGFSSALQSVRYLQADFLEASVTLFESEAVNGKLIDVFNQGIPDLEQAGYSKETQSIHVKKGMWVAYQQKHFCGEQYILEKGKYKSFLDWGGNNNTILSIRPVILEPYGKHEPKHMIDAYSDVNFQGNCQSFTNEVSEFQSFLPQSFKVLRGCWLLCYKGESSENLCVLEEGIYPDMVSCGCPAAVIKYIKPIDYVFAEPSISLFALDSCEGRELNFEEAVNSVLSKDLHFYTQSVWIRSGLWIAYEGANFLGKQILLEPQQISNWAEFSGWKAIDSLRPLKQPAVYFRIKNRLKDKYLTVAGTLTDTRATFVSISPSNGQSTQIWYFCRGLLKSKANDSCLDVIGGKNLPGSKVSLWTEHGKTRQKWRINKDGTITSYISDNLVLDLKGGNYYDQNHVVVNQFQESELTQKWDIEIL